MTNQEQSNGEGARGHRNLWQALADHWFEDLPEGKELKFIPRWFVATIGTVTFLSLYFNFSSESALDPIKSVVGGMELGIYAFFAVGLGFLLAWKRERTGPVRLFISGITLPAFVLLAAKLATLFGGPP